MKLVQISDIHLVTPGETLLGFDPLQRLDAGLAHIAAYHADADLVLVTGDLSDTGAADTYAALKERLSAFALPTRLLLGNHDNRVHFATAFPDAVDADGFAQAAIDIGAARVLALDTLDDGNVGGRLCGRRLEWLAARLDEARGRPVYVFMHHPAGPILMPSLDPISLAEPDVFLALLKAHGDVRHVFAGHVHRLVTGHWQGVAFSLLRSANHQTALDLVSDQARTSYEAPAIAIILAQADQLIIHFDEY